MLIEDAPCFPLALVRENQKPAILVVPKLELARALFGVSSRFLLDMIVGLRDPKAAPDAGLFDRTRSALQPDGTVRIFTGRRLFRREAIMVAAYLSDPHIRRFYDGVLQTMVVQPGHRQFQPVYPDPPYPFPEVTTWSFDYRWLVRPTVADSRLILCMVVTRITEITFPLRFAAVEIHRPVSKLDPSLPPPTASDHVRQGGGELLGVHRGSLRGFRPRSPHASRQRR